MCAGYVRDLLDLVDTGIIQEEFLNCTTAAAERATTGIRVRLSNLKSAEKRARVLAKTRKSLFNLLRAKRLARPVFIAGMQRSGTTMLMNVFHLRPDTSVFDEARNSTVFKNFRIRDVGTLRRGLMSQSLPIAVFKVICDSHEIVSLFEAFPDAKVLWMYRNPGDNADSQLKKFEHPVKAIKLVHAGEQGGGWFAEGVSENTRRTLHQFRGNELSDFDWACLNWWARNQLFFEQDLASDKRVEVLRYEELVANPIDVMGQVIDWLGMPYHDRSFRFVHSRSVNKTDRSSLNPEIERLCQSVLDSLDNEQRFLPAILPA